MFYYQVVDQVGERLWNKWSVLPGIQSANVSERKCDGRENFSDEERMEKRNREMRLLLGVEDPVHVKNKGTK